jgi:5-methylthioadenosine/S-adenosylhomocysteine deaminase
MQCAVTKRFAASLLTMCLAGLTTQPSLAQDPGRTLIRNADLVITMEPRLGDGELGLIASGDVLIDGDHIAAVGKGLDGSGARTVDATGKIVLPGFVDVHNHLWQSLIRGCGTSLAVGDWLQTCVFPVGRLNVTEQEAYAVVRLSTLDLLSAGMTTVVDWSHAFSPDFARGNLQALLDSGLRFAFAYRGRLEHMDDIRALKRDMIDPHPRASLQIGGVHPNSAAEVVNTLRRMSELAGEMHVKLHVHLLEAEHDRQQDPLRALDLAGALGPRLIGAHAVHVTDDEIVRLASRGVRLAHCPLSNMRLASGIMRLGAIRAQGIRVGLGLDGGTNDTSDMFNTMRAAIGLQRALTHNPTVYPTVAAALQLATIGGAEVLDMAAQIGSLAPGKKADVIVLDPDALNFAPRVDEVSQVVFNAQPSNVEWVFVDGRVLKDRGTLVGVDAKTVIADANRAAQRVRAALIR